MHRVNELTAGMASERKRRSKNLKNEKQNSKE
jgi:hypothetical protein